MPPEPEIETLAHAIQLAITPVFLFAGVAGFLNVLTNRLARITDRTRMLEGPCTSGEARQLPAAVEAELAALRVRTWLINVAIVLCTLCAVLVSSVVAAIFLATFVEADFRYFVASAFIATMICLIAGLLVFLAEVHRAIRFLRSEAQRRAELRRASPPVGSTLTETTI